MGSTIARGLDGLIDHYVVACIFLAQLIMTLIGVGNVGTVSALGLLLCIVGLAQRSVWADPWILIPLILYNLISMISTFAAYGNITDGYGALQSVFPVIYLLMACLSGQELHILKRLCAAWTGVTALCGVCGFVWQATVLGQTGRLSGLLGNPNAMGIFLVMGWFALMSCETEERLDVFLHYLEPIVLCALALTLSMGSFVAMAAGVLVLLTGQKRNGSWKETFCYACVLLSKASLGIGIGVLLYLTASRTSVPWLCLPLLLYGAAAVILWQKYEYFLHSIPWMAALLSASGVLIALVIVFTRPSAIATFTERLEMMESAVHYLTVNPLLGVGPYQWRMLDLQDGGIYFNTWHIHNALLHVGVEMGWIAMGMLAAVAVRFFCKHPKSSVKAEITAFLIHNMMDTSFFYLGIISLALITGGDPKGKPGNRLAVKAVFGLFAAIFAWNLYCAIRAA